jgi:NAD(P)-dependent dehydrogenase (short-subunit alcohol dehydrogenase family)
MSRVLITGASSPIAKSLFGILSNEQREVLLHSSKTITALDREYAESTAKFWIQNFLNLDNLETSFRTCMANVPEGVDTFVHISGMVSPLKASGVTNKIISNHFNVNVFSALKIVALLLNKSINGSELKNIVFITSIWSKFGASHYSVYSSSKAALAGAMRSLSIELAPRVRVNCVALGTTDSGMAEKVLNDEKKKKKLLEQYPLGIGEPADVAELVNFLISNKSRWLTGQEIFLDGGATTNMEY